LVFVQNLFLVFKLTLEFGKLVVFGVDFVPQSLDFGLEVLLLVVQCDDAVAQFDDCFVVFLEGGLEFGHQLLLRVRQLVELLLGAL